MARKPPQPKDTQPADWPMPQDGGSYERDPVTGALTRRPEPDEGPAADATPAPTPDEGN